jgi:predicted NUDIX family phosphoesterase
MPKKYPDEKVLVVSRTLLDELGSFQGFNPEAHRYLPSFLEKENNYFLERDDAEDDPSHKQIIPYAIFHHQGRLLHYVRGGASGEKRLASKGSIGIGGHINAEDEEASSLEKDTYMTGVEREVDEELNIDSHHTQTIVGLINDDSTEVGSVHLGVVHLFDLASDTVTSNEDNIVDLEFLTREELTARHDQLETWSQTLVENLDTILPSG